LAQALNTPSVTIVSARLTIQILKYSLPDPSNRKLVRRAGASGAGDTIASISGFPNPTVSSCHQLVREARGGGISLGL
jgi:hypothetical protein